MLGKSFKKVCNSIPCPTLSWEGGGYKFFYENKYPWLKAEEPFIKLTQERTEHYIHLWGSRERKYNSESVLN